VGTITGANGTFTVIGTHTISAAGSFAVRVTVVMSVPDRASASAFSTAKVSKVSKPGARRHHRPHDFSRRGDSTRRNRQLESGGSR
jgi:hypothetical protein